MGYVGIGAAGGGTIILNLRTNLFTNLQQILQSQHTLNPNLFFTNLTGSATNVEIGQFKVHFAGIKTKEN